MASTELTLQDLTALRAALAQQADRIARRNQLASMLQSLQREAARLEQRAIQLQQTLAREEADVERLKKMSATAILYTILGKKEAKFDKEAQEAAAARLNYTAAVQQLEDTQARIQTAQQELDTLQDAQDRYNALFAQLRQLLLRGVERLKNLFRGSRSRSEVVATFLAILDLCKTNSVTLEDDPGGENPNVRLLDKHPREEMT